jgi:hypothetical protein
MSHSTVVAVAAVVALTFCSSAAAQPSLDKLTPDAASTRADAAAPIPPFLKNLAQRFVRQPPRRIALRVGKRAVKRAGKEWLESGGTECVFPFPEKFCSVATTRWGLGQAVWSNGRPPGVWNRTYAPRREISEPLVPGKVYYLTCWLLGDRVYGPFGSTNLWYRVTNGGYVSDALLYTGTNDVIPGVAHC